MGRRRTLDDMMLSIRAFQESRVLLTALELDLFTVVGEGAVAVEAAARAGADPRATEMLLNALTALGALRKQDGVFRCTPESTALGTARAELMHTVHLWETWSTLTECVRTGTTQRSPGHEGRREDWTGAFIAAMHARARTTAEQVVRAVGSEPLGRMLDVGGGPATYSIAFAQAHPRLRAEVLDLEPVLSLAERNIREAGLSDRVPDPLRSSLLDPSIIVPPLLWLASGESDRVTGHRVVATRWRTDLDGRAAVEAVIDPAGWP